MTKFKFEGTVILEAENLDEAFLRLARYFLMLSLDEEPPEEHLAGTNHHITRLDGQCGFGVKLEAEE